MAENLMLPVDTIRCLAVDVVQGAKSGHPGAPMGCAPMAHVLFAKIMQYDPSDPDWYNRDRFVLSNGHASALLYSMLHLAGYEDLSMDQLKKFRQLGSKTPGHPERHVTRGVEVTTGPLGQGIANAVGMAIAERHMAAVYNRPGFNLFSHRVYSIAGDGCLQEGVSAEACSLAGHLKLGNLVVLYDDNGITIDGSTKVSFTEDVAKRFEAYGWHVQKVANGDTDLAAIEGAVAAAQVITEQPSLICVRTTIGYKSKMENTAKVHGSPLGPEEIAVVKSKLGLDPGKLYNVPPEVYELYRVVVAQNKAVHKEWDVLFSKYAAKFPSEAAEISRRFRGELPNDWETKLPTWIPGDRPLATRQASGIVLNAIAETLPELVGGSADLTGSNLTGLKCSHDFQHGAYDGRYFRFGVREHGMAAIMNGMQAYGGLIPFGATFLVFTTYALGAIRVAALSHQQALYVFTHDSIGLGEDGPTHQPVEVLSALRATPNVLVFRPADGNETSGCYKVALEYTRGPSVLALSRQGVPHLEGSAIDKCALGAYIVQDCTGAPDVVITATGSEVEIALAAAAQLGSSVRVISAPCLDLLLQQPEAYQRLLYPPNTLSVSVEAGTAAGWTISHVHIGIDGRFGVSAPIKAAYADCKLDVPSVVARISELKTRFAAVYSAAGQHIPDLVTLNAM